MLTCEGCKGTGKWPTLNNPEGIHFACKGTGSLKAMSEAQYSFIRVLFMELVTMNIIVKNDDEWNKTVNTMKNHKAGIALQSTRWGSNKIEELKARKKRAFARVNPAPYPEQHGEPQEETDIYGY